MIELAALESQAIDFGVPPGFESLLVAGPVSPVVWSAPASEYGVINLTTWWANAAPEVTSGASIQPEPQSRGTTAPTCSGLTTFANDGERLGRLAWVPGSR